MDGYALRAADTPGRLPVVFRIAAGLPADRALAPGEAMAISTGGAVPDGADAVDPDRACCRRQTTNSRSPSRSSPARTSGRSGGDVRAGDVVLAQAAPASARRRSAHWPRRASPRSPVRATPARRRPQHRDRAPRAGRAARRRADLRVERRRCSRPRFAAAGATVERLGPVADDEDEHRPCARARAARRTCSSARAASRSARTTSSAGSWRELGVEEDFWGVAVRPGKPLAFGVRGATLVFGLPGNPVSSLVAVELFVRPALLALQGAAEPGPRTSRRRLASPASAERRARRARRRADARDERRDSVEPLGGQESHMIVRAAGADALVSCPRARASCRPERPCACSV